MATRRTRGGMKIEENREIQELTEAIDRYHNTIIQQAGSDNEKIKTIEIREYFRNRLIGELYDNLYKSEQNFIDTLTNFVLYKGDELVDKDMGYAIQRAGANVIESALLHTLASPEHFYHNKKIVNIFRPKDLTAYVDYFQQSKYINELNQVDEEAIIEDLRYDHQDHHIIDTRDYIQQELDVDRKFFKTHIKKYIRYVVPYFEGYPAMFAYALCSTKILTKDQAHCIMRIYFAKKYQYIKENDIIDQRY